MSNITRGNWIGRDPGDDIPDGSTITGGNFSQLLDGTPIMAGKPLTIIDGNFTNVLQDPAWTVEGGNWRQVEYCQHLHPEMGLPAEAEDCDHVVDTHTVTIDGVVVDTTYEREDTRV